MPGECPRPFRVETLPQLSLEPTCLELHYTHCIPEEALDQMCVEKTLPKQQLTCQLRACP